MVRSIREGGTVHKGRRYSSSGQVVRYIRAGGTVHQGRLYGPLGKAVRSIRAGGTVHQGRRYGPSGQAVLSIREGVRSIRAGSADRPPQYKFPLPESLLQLSWARLRDGPVL